MRRVCIVISLLSGAALLGAAGAHAQMPLLDAGQQAMIMHKGELIEKQTAPNNKKATKSQAGANCTPMQQRAALQPEYERRDRTEGREATNSWRREARAALREHAKAAGQC